MIYLLAKYTLLFLLTAILGFVLGHWYSRRNFVDVSESYEDLRKANARSDEDQWIRLWDTLEAMPKPKETDLGGVLQRLDGVQETLVKLPKPVDLEPIGVRLDSLNESVRGIPIPVTPKPVDLQPLQAEMKNDLSALRDEIRQLPVVETHPPVDLAPINTKIETVQKGLSAIPRPDPVDLQPLRVEMKKELGALRDDIRRLPVVETHAPVDLAPINTKIESVQKGLGAIPRPDRVDLKPIDRRLSSIESGLGKISKQVAGLNSGKPRTTKVERPRKKERGQPRILSAALYGKKDDLKKISGVGPKLERLLNSNGVFYFWQVAEWNKRDVDIIDQRLDTFKGRIWRDNWVDQARHLRRTPDAASMPSEA